MRIGLDIDGVLANFNDTFIERCVEVTGRDLFPARPFDIPVWHYPAHFGYTQEEVSAVLASIRQDGIFWRTLFPYADAHQAFQACGEWVHQGDEVYFITDRQGVKAKHQTEQWLDTYLPTGIHPTVLITPHKGLAAQTLRLDAYVDDKVENCHSTAVVSGCKVFMRNQPWNAGVVIEGVTRIDHMGEFVKGAEECRLLTK